MAQVHLLPLLLNGGLSLMLKLLKCGYMMKNLAGWVRKSTDNKQ
jgi:hypothetical protein